MKTKSRQSTIETKIHQEEEKDRRQFNQDPLGYLNKSQTKRLEDFFLLSAEENDDLSQN